MAESCPQSGTNHHRRKQPSKRQLSIQHLRNSRTHAGAKAALLLHLQLQLPILLNLTSLRRQQRALGRRVLRFESVADRLHRDPLDAFEFVDVFDVARWKRSASRVFAGKLACGRYPRFVALTAQASLNHADGRRHPGAR